MQTNSLVFSVIVCVIGLLLLAFNRWLSGLAGEISNALVPQQIEKRIAWNPRINIIGIAVIIIAGGLLNVLKQLGAN